MSLAKINGLFRLTQDAELIYSQAGVPILKMGLVNSEKYKDKETTLFIDAVAFSKPAEILNQYAGAKGTQIYLTGKLQTENWVDNQGQKRSKISMVVETFDFVSNKDSSQQQQQQQSYQAPQQQQSYNQQTMGQNAPVEHQQVQQQVQQQQSGYTPQSR